MSVGCALEMLVGFVSAACSKRHTHTYNSSLFPFPSSHTHTHTLTNTGPVELEQVHSSLLLPPHDPAAPQSVLTAGHFEPGDRVVVVTGTGAPAFGARGTVIGVMPTVVELLMDEEYAGGCGGGCENE